MLRRADLSEGCERRRHPVGSGLEEGREVSWSAGVPGGRSLEEGAGHGDAGSRVVAAGQVLAGVLEQGFDQVLGELAQQCHAFITCLCMVQLLFTELTEPFLHCAQKVITHCFLQGCVLLSPG